MIKLRNIIKQIQFLYPKGLVLLSVFPLVLGLFINFELVDSREFLINLIWIPIFVFPILLIKTQRGFNVLASIYFVLGCLELLHWTVLNGPISLTSILVISNTNTNEASDFIDDKLSFKVLLLLPYIYIFYKTITTPIFKENRTLKLKICLPFISVLAIFIIENAVNNRLVRKGIPHFAKVSVSSYNRFELFNQARQNTNPKEVQVKIEDKNAKEIFVLILGESCNRNHMSLYGYERDTNPRLKQRKDLVIYDNVVSAYSSTLNSVLTMLSESNLENKKEMTSGFDVIDIFHSAGFQTNWISNQSPIGIWDNMITVLANKSDRVDFVNLVSNSSMEATYTVSYDEKVLKPFNEVIRKPNTKKFIVIHLMGSHSKYSKRYPKEFSRFEGEGKKARQIAEYDNSILYNDYIVDSVFTLLKQYEKENASVKSSALYIADHGENVYDEFDALGHDYAHILPKSNVEIPFMVWFSDKYKRENKTQTKALYLNKSKPYVSDDLFHTILDINGIKTNSFEPNRSVANPLFNEKRKRTLENNKDYDLGY